MSETWLAERILLLVPLWLSLTVHEWAHAWTAWQLGDPTGQREGRVTLDPLAHIDPVGTFFLPLLGVPFGWAKPVPVNVALLGRGSAGGMSAGLLLVAAAGPLSNLLLAALAAGLAHLLAAFGADARTPVQQALGVVVLLNAALAIFNLLPVPPLDGSRIVEALLPEAARDAYARLAPIAPFLLAGVLVIPALVGVDLLAPAKLLAARLMP